jgi:hypothetical protein
LKYQIIISEHEGKKMSNEFKKRIELLDFDSNSVTRIMKLIMEAGKEFPCQKCPSKDECENYKWFLKWFGVKI